MEHAALGTSVTPRSDRVALRENGTIPNYFRIYVGNHASASRSGSTRHSHTMARSPDGPSPSLDGTERNIQTITILMGRLFIHLNAARVDGFEIEDAYFISRVWAECRIWPNASSSLIWPHRPLVGNDGLSMIANTLQKVFSSEKVRWLDDLPKN